MSEMVERVAKAIEDAMFGGLEPFGQLRPKGSVVGRKLARAAIAAMREPTEAMLVRGYSVDQEEMYQAMIDEALRGSDNE